MRAHLSLSLVLIVLLAACAGPGRGTMYSRSDVQRPWTVREATVVQVTEATIEGRDSEVGTIGGGFIGHSLGRSVGQGSGSSIAGAVAAVAGVVIGKKTEKAATQKKAWELLVELNSGGETLAIVQPADQSFDTGEKVRIYTRSDGAARVAKL